MLVLKFGGTSVGSPQAIRKLINVVCDVEHAGRTRVVVVSAFSGITDQLIETARLAEAGDGTYEEKLMSMRKRHEEVIGEICTGEDRSVADEFVHTAFEELSGTLNGIRLLSELSARTLDYVMSFGERLSAFIVAYAFRSSGVQADFMDARLVLRTDDQYGSAVCQREESYANVRAVLNSRPALQIATGFIASTAEGRTTTLGRGGSDLSSALFGAAIGAEEIEIWTDVDGILTADPKLVKSAFRIESISYEEAMELSHFGAKVLHPPTVRPAFEKGIPIRIRNTFNPSCPGTLIASKVPPSQYPVRGISSMRDITLLRVQGAGMVGVTGFSSRLFGALARRKIYVILISQASSEHSICFAVLPKDAVPAGAAIKEEFEREIAAGAIDYPAIERDLSIIAVVGEGMKRIPGIAGKVFHSLGRNGVNIIAIAQGSSELNISAVIARKDESKALNAIHEAFFLSGVRSVNLFLIGVGLIGGTLLEQLARQRVLLSDQHRIRVNLIGVANSRRMAFDRHGMDPASAKASLDSGEPFKLDEFVARMRELNLPNTAFCDCTAGDTVPSVYLDLLKMAIPIVTPNKRANSGLYVDYRALVDYSRERGIPYLYETTVCAGLPVISTLHDLFVSGDQVRRIEAVVSGTLSYIFNNWDGTKTFSSLVKEAKAKGYTEPDPRDDLNAMDAARKALILARECGMALEFKDVEIEPILPDSCLKASTVDSFFIELEKVDAEFETKRASAAARGKGLRYVAIIEEGRARILLKEVAAGDPFLSLVDADNIVVVTSDRYSTLPLVVKGPGAGAQVTAGGVFADIVRIARTLV
ncbi:MAG: bifunctional aspartate kinase/homoserine dehydrogenase I [Treponemataceae bacterium]